MNSRSEICITRGLRHEGGYVNHPEDPGGPTNRGITLATYRRYLKPDANAADLRAMPLEAAIHIYRRRYWEEIRGDDLPDGVDYAVYDYCINSGRMQASRDLQRVAGVPADGRIGPVTLAAVRKMDPEEVVIGVMQRRLQLMKSIRNKETGTLLWLVFGEGWQKRLDIVYAEALNDIQKAKQQKTAAASPWVRFLETLLKKLRG